ncbi:hypothetical protein DSA95_16145 [Salmonella enterica subsp. enterica serovar Plymouth]|uniref:Uncharacterized protein n=1 Tax=Salmonella enteritidis TaxID=149539 RepID=A0A5V0BEG7_SALEN|nr:hypothetical protein [Salmonella enterica subsp. enterica serovar Enteritidis]EBS5544124.1 hypothetical protein [Salmonella enterica subsp. enterica serovar Plymouth]EBW7767459.1 hypothetical protein [Salmonella enterica subsp. enterica serovar Louisiana]ECI3619715.1 hypothetical protein [Salmonella enterica subsp. enterica]EBX4512328.1 hypothetical protein [Salmonella enterica subsp. enterica serovar Plymouth]
MAFSAMNRLPMLSCGEPDTDVEAGMNLLAGVLPLRHASVWGALPRNGALSGCTDTGHEALQEGWLTWSATFLSLKYLNDPACRRTVVINDFGQ